MFNLYSPELMTIEHNLRVAPVERYGWLRFAASGKRLDGFVAGFVARLSQSTRARRVVDTSPARDAITPAGQVQGAS
jgi:hypothetical protein